MKLTKVLSDLFVKIISYPSYQTVIDSRINFLFLENWLILEMLHPNQFH